MLDERHQTQMGIRTLIGLATLTVIAMAVDGCGKRPHANDGPAGGSVETAAKPTSAGFEQDVRDESRWSEQAAGESGQAAERFAGKVGNAADNDQTSLAVQSALIAAANMPTSHLHVETHGRQVVLSGRVPSEEQKQAAAQIAHDVVGSGYTVEDRLTVVP